MKATNDEIEYLTKQLKDWNAQITVLALKQEVTETLTTKLAQEIRELRAKHLEAKRQLGDLELHRSGMYM